MIVKKVLINVFRITCIILAFSFSACSGYLGNNSVNTGEGQNEHLLMSDGSGYLSSDNHNEITPYLYRSGNRAWLFFASDREGHYNLYFAEMDSGGRFYGLTKMDTNINSSYDEFSPVVFQAILAPSYNTNTYISFLKSSPGSTDVYTAMIDDKFNGISPASLSIQTLNATHISLFNKNIDTAIGQNEIAVSYGFSVSSNFYWDYYTLSNWNNTSSFAAFDVGLSGKIISMDGYPAPSPYYGQLFLIDMPDNNNTLQLYYGAIWDIYSPASGTSTITNINKIPDYYSSYDDAYPCIDLATMKVYFSSKRYGRGYWNLYRFNIQTFDKQIQWNHDATNHAS